MKRIIRKGGAERDTILSWALFIVALLAALLIASDKRKHQMNLNDQRPSEAADPRPFH